MTTQFPGLVHALQLKVTLQNLEARSIISNEIKGDIDFK